MTTKIITAALLLLTTACAPEAEPLSWDEIRCDGDGLCFGRMSGDTNWMLVVQMADLADLPVIDPPCVPGLDMDVVCVEVDGEPECFAGFEDVVDGVLVPYSCTPATAADLPWPEWMCGGGLDVVDPGVMDTAGCSHPLATSCTASSGAATFEVWPPCLIDTLVAD